MPVVNRRNGVPTPEQARLGNQVGAAIRWSKGNQLELVKLARDRSKAALLKLERLMNGDAGMMKAMHPVTGVVVELPIEVPPAVQAKCAELIIERGYGKSPQALLIQDDTPEGRRMLTTAEKIAAIQAARNVTETTTDLEASEITEAEIVPPSPTPSSGTGAVPEPAAHPQPALLGPLPLVPDPRDLI